MLSWGEALITVRRSWKAARHASLGLTVLRLPVPRTFVKTTSCLSLMHACDQVPRVCWKGACRGHSLHQGTQRQQCVVEQPDSGTLVQASSGSLCTVIGCTCQHVFSVFMPAVACAAGSRAGLAHQDWAAGVERVPGADQSTARQSEAGHSIWVHTTSLLRWQGDRYWEVDMQRQAGLEAQGWVA